MQAATLPMSAGWLWIAQGYRLFLRQPLALFLWGMTTATLIMASYLLFPLGQIVLIAATPVLTFITLNLCRVAAGGKTLRLSMWFVPLRPAPIRKRLVKLGLSYLACSLAGGFLAVIPFISQLAAAVGPENTWYPQVLAQAMVGPLILFFFLYVVISALFWHAPALIGWHDLTLARALFFSTVACWRNKWPFLLYGLSWGAIFFSVQSLTGWLLDAKVSPTVVQLLLTPANILVLTVLYCSFYPTYVSVFNTQADSPPPAA